MRKLLLLILLWSLYLVYASAESVVIVDHSRDLSNYSAEVASWVRQPQWYPKEEGTSAPCIVLIRTTGDAPEISQCPPTVLISGPRHRYTAVYPSQAEASACISLLNGADNIIYCELDQPIRPAESTADATAAEDITFKSWGAAQMEFAGFNAYARVAGQGSCTVAIIDSGVYRHSLLRPRLTTSGFDYVDIDFDSTNDVFGHGTNVAGIVVDCTPGLPVYILPIRILDSSGYGSIANAINAIEEAVNSGADVINLSLSMQGHSSALDDAILSARDAGAMVVIAAGNNSADTSGICPAHLQQTGLIVVGAATGGDYVADYSNDGVSVDMYAYGSGIQCCSVSGGYTSASGTSMATPHISAACATLEVLHPGMTAYAMENWLKASCTDTEASVPRLSRLTPQSLPLQLSLLNLPPGQEIALFTQAFPLSCQQTVDFESSNTDVARVENGRLTTHAEGSATITASVGGWLPLSFTVQVSAGCSGISTLPAALGVIGDEAFRGTAVSVVYLPDGISVVGENVFDPGASVVILCTPDSPAHRTALAEGWPCILTPPEQIR